MKIEDLVDFRVTNITTLNPIFEFNRSVYLTIECFWRVILKDDIKLSSNEFQKDTSDKRIIESLIPLFVDSRIVSISVAERTADLYIEFDNGLTLECYSDSEICESWTISGPNDFLKISLPGGNLM